MSGPIFLSGGKSERPPSVYIISQEVRAFPIHEFTSLAWGARQSPQGWVELAIDTLRLHHY